MDFSKWLTITEAKSDKIIVYHGTVYDNLSGIMSQGLIPAPPKRAWGKDDDTSYYSASRKSLEGIYVTTNLMTAVSSTSNAANRGKDGIIVIAEVQPKTGFVDEDDMNMFVSAAPNEYIVKLIHVAIQSKSKDPIVEKYFDKYKDNLKHKLSELVKDPHPSMMKRLSPLFWQLFVKSIARQMVYVDKRTFKYDYPGIRIPDKATAEKDFLRIKEELTKTLKMFANPANLKDEGFNFTTRIMEPIRFSGANKIIAIVSYPRSDDPPEVLYGTVPGKFIKDYEQVIGKWKPKTE